MNFFSQEFLHIYNLLFDESSNSESKKQAYDWMVVWKIRRFDSTPASIQSTLALIEVELKKNSNIDNDLQMMYSSAFTRFLNYMTSINQTGQFKNMYASTKELGLESFLVDLRHICAHGQNMPSLDVLKRTSTYCVKWLKQFYWDRELKLLTNVTVEDLRTTEQSRLINDLDEVFHLYDKSSEIIFKGYSNISQVVSLLKPEHLQEIKSSKFDEIDKNKLAILSQDSLNRFVNRAKTNKTIQDYKHILLHVLLRDRFFIEAPFYESKNSNLSINSYQILFRLIASLGLIEDVFYKLIKKMENRNEPLPMRSGAAFWADQIMNGFYFLTKLKRMVKLKMDTDQTYKMNLLLINTKNISKSLITLCEEMGYDQKSHLIFGESEMNPINFVIQKDFLMKRILHVNEISANFVRHCIELVSENEVPFEDKKQLLKLIAVYTSTNECSGENDVEAEETTNLEILGISDNNEDTSIWRDAPGKYIKLK